MTLTSLIWSRLMLKEYTVKKMKCTCDGCGLEKEDDSRVFSSHIVKWYKMRDKDFCDRCYFAIVDELIKQDVISKEILDTVTENFDPKTRDFDFNISTIPCTTRTY